MGNPSTTLPYPHQWLHDRGLTDCFISELQCGTTPYVYAAMPIESTVDPNSAPATPEELARCLAEPMWRLNRWWSVVFHAIVSSMEPQIKIRGFCLRH